MSLVDTGPLLLGYVERYSPKEYSQLNVPLGLNDWAQINGRNTLSREEMSDLSAWLLSCSINTISD